MRPSRLFILVNAALLGAGCAATPPSRPNVNLSGYPPAFQEGYADGCHSARVLIGVRKDEARFKKDNLYAQGWRDGYDICSKR
ncbi:hypothetical protein [Pelomicrobium sp.]|jgi:hypothetical protein|uniref:hypothetical protein n=1 Tax=Pelomicrobium sp. TaxID=2815319 RepID=UPI002FDE22C4